jgi:preprotein translocase subunit SecB
MEHKNFPIALEQMFFTRSIVIASPDFKPGNEQIKILPENKIEVSTIEGDRRRYIATMQSIFNKNSDTTMPYMFDMECIGFFIVEEGLEKEEITRVVTITAHNVLYGAIRESVAWLTGRQPHGQVMLGLSVLHSSLDPQDSQ